MIRKPVQCPKLPCKNPVKEDGLCCPVCKSKLTLNKWEGRRNMYSKCTHFMLCFPFNPLEQCLLNGRVLEHNQRIKKHCLTCTCNVSTFHAVLSLDLSKTRTSPYRMDPSNVDMKIPTHALLSTAQKQNSSAKMMNAAGFAKVSEL